MKSRLEQDTVLPITWVAVGDPAQRFSPDRHDEVWAVQQELDFPGTVYGVDRGTPMSRTMEHQKAFFGSHRADRSATPGSADFTVL